MYPLGGFTSVACTLGGVKSIACTLWVALQVSHVPPGWDSWLGLVGNSQYYHYSVSDNGVRVQHGDDYSNDYFTDVIANRSRIHAYTHAHTDNTHTSQVVRISGQHHERSPRGAIFYVSSHPCLSWTGYSRARIRRWGKGCVCVCARGMCARGKERCV